MSLAYRAYRFAQYLKLKRYGIAEHMSVFSHTTPEERIALHEVARSLPNGARVLEIGSHIGSSALLLGAALAPKLGRLYCIDTWQNETMPDGEVDTYATFKANTKQYESIITPLRQRSETVTFKELGAPLDMVFIDGDHSEEGVRTDFKLVENWLGPQGVIAFHDISNTYPGVHKVFGEALASGDWQMAGFAGCLGWLKRTQS